MKRLLSKISVFVMSLGLLAAQVPIFPTPTLASAAPVYTVSRYVTNPSNAYNWGYAAGQAATNNSGPADSLVILDFGEPTATGSLLVNGTSLTTAQIVTYTENFLGGFWAGTPSWPHVTVAIGTNNCGSNVTNATGQAWGNSVNAVNAYIASAGFTSQETAIGANDMEIDWNTASTTRNWVDGYNSTANYRLYDYGDDAGGLYPGNGWTANDVWYVAYGAPKNWPVPEIYNSNCATLDWGPMNQWAVANKSAAINFMGTLTEYAADSSTFTPSQGWTALSNATGQAMTYSTDITWAN
ncbi:hypothetical protein REC12_23625 [Desulfosporosinus sp. PR]|uniref:hypothetical protein n=1 Tax=Candidatus Desulfosporosinus nitrosoreducens TaxID=3401928 RepID=UPI0027F010EA|nr:hypothetical protein [Desulfosporosinus sp. PR]MDQ7096590.1 hypothetical protein [Desulfosporosinus sp. PR]